MRLTHPYDSGAARAFCPPSIAQTGELLVGLHEEAVPLIAPCSPLAQAGPGGRPRVRASVGVSACVRVCVWVWVHACVYACMVWVRVRVWVCVWVWVRACVRTGACVRVWARVRVCVWAGAGQHQHVHLRAVGRLLL